MHFQIHFLSQLRFFKNFAFSIWAYKFNCFMAITFFYQNYKRKNDEKIQKPTPASIIRAADFLAEFSYRANCEPDFFGLNKTIITSNAPGSTISSSSQAKNSAKYIIICISGI